LNKEPGPDFRDAVIQFDSSPAIVGDVEIDLQASGWRGHGHAANPAIKSCSPCTVGRSATAKSDRPRLALKKLLDSPLRDLERWLSGEPAPVPGALMGQCSGPLRDLSPEIIPRTSQSGCFDSFSPQGC